MNTRPTWDQYFMLLAQTAALRSTCDRKHVGAVVVSSDNHVIGMGYNGAPANWPHCDDKGHELMKIEGRDSCVRTLHAEQNAITRALRHSPLESARIYVTSQPCYDCLKLIYTARILDVIYAEPYHSARSPQDTNIVAGPWRGLRIRLLDDPIILFPASMDRDLHSNAPPVQAYSVEHRGQPYPDPKALVNVLGDNVSSTIDLTEERRKHPSAMHCPTCREAYEPATLHKCSGLMPMCTKSFQPLNRPDEIYKCTLAKDHLGNCTSPAIRAALKRDE